MTPQTTICEVLRDRSLIERYVAGTLAEPEASELESHYLTCASCQADVRLAAAIAGTPALPALRRSLRWPGVAIAIAAGLGIVLIARPDRHAAELARLGGVPAPPAYQGIAIRSGAAPADSVFDDGMAAYAAGRYHDAIAALDAALRAGADPAPAGFFRAASLLMTGRNDAAAEGFGRVITLGSTVYLPEAQYYFAKALLRLGRDADALGALRSIGPDRADIVTAAAALADSVAAVAR